MSTPAFLKREAHNIWTQYQPVITEVNGLADLANGVTGLVLSSLCRCINSNTDPGSLQAGAITASQAVEISAIEIMVGLIKLSVPISIASGYLACKNFF